MLIIDEIKKLSFWKNRGVKRGIPYSIEELLLKHKRIKYFYIFMIGGIYMCGILLTIILVELLRL